MLLNALFALLLLLSLLLFFVYTRFRGRTQYWQQLGVATPTDCPFPFGSDPRMSRSTFFGAENVGDVTERLYNQFRSLPYFGTYFFLGRPVLVVNDPNIIRDVMVKEFGHFVDRRADAPFAHSTTLSDQIWSKQITSLKGEQWKEVRSALSPFFSSGKLRAMTQLMRVTAQAMMDEVERHRVNDQEVNFRKVCGTFVMATLASCAFGIDLRSGDAHTNRFKQSVYNILSRPPKDFIKVMTTLFLPGGRKLLNALGISVTKEEETVFFYNVVRDAMKQRRSGQVSARHDLIDQMIKVVANEQKGEEHEEDDNKGLDEQFARDAKLDRKSRATPEFGDLDVAALAIVFMVAGYDTSSTTLTYLLHELAMNPDIQEGIYNEIVDVCGNDLEKEITYEHLNELEQLDMAIHETLRLHAPTGQLIRVCVEDFRVDDKIQVPKGMEVFIPVLGIHHDERYYPEPMKFDPSRFGKEEKAQRSPYTFFGFGQGPRSCIGTRFALVEAKLGLSMLIRKYRLVAGKATPKKLTRDPGSILGCAKEDVVLKLELR